VVSRANSPSCGAETSIFAAETETELRPMQTKAKITNSFMMIDVAMCDVFGDKCF